MHLITNNILEIALHGEADRLWSIRSLPDDTAHAIAAPVFPIDGTPRTAALREITPIGTPVPLANGCTEYRFTGLFADAPELSLEMIFRVAADSPVVRFRYVLHGKEHRLTKEDGRDALTYLGASFAAFPEAQEVRFSEFNEQVHSYCLSERPLSPADFENGLPVMGPMLLGESKAHTLLFAYEHGSQVPDAFLQFRLAPNRTVSLQAVKGNYYDGQEIDSYETIWLLAAVVDGPATAMARAFRRFLLHYQTLNRESRKPYIFYNTWAYQERNHWWNGKPYLESMNQERILQEIEVAHRMGIDVFVLDTGWYEKTGDWAVNRSRFPDNLQAVREKLEGYGMKLGLWLGPTSAALSSAILRRNRDCVRTRHGQESKPTPIWETEESQSLCMVSRYSDAFAEELIRMVKEIGVTYFKWDAIDLYGCDSASHWHGTEENSESERTDCYAFQLMQVLTRITDKVCAACPETIIDFGIDEPGRSAGLGFLAAGKFFLMNNGPYYRNYDIPRSRNEWSNIFVHPGPARGWVCRTPLSFDKWIPSVLFLTHYLPDDPESSQILNIASLILGQNGIWGDLLQVSAEGVDRFGAILRRYKQVRDDITESDPVCTGAAGGSPEIHEKVWEKSGRGAVVFFAGAGGNYEYVTAHRVAEQCWHTEGVTVERAADGRAKLTTNFSGAGAQIVLFGVE